MCNDFERHIAAAALAQALAEARLAELREEDLRQLTPAEVRVGDVTPILRAEGNGVTLAPMRWGFAPARQGGAPVFNFKSEGRRFGQSKRCLVPASAFFEFTGARSPKSKWRFALPDEPAFAVAGLWRDDPGGSTFTMLTVAPGEDIRPFHDRQIAVLAPREWASWLYLDRPEAELLTPLPAGTLSVALVRQGRE